MMYHIFHNSPEPVLSPRYPDSVFVLCDAEGGGFEPVGTCFAITGRHLLSCQHFMSGKHRNCIIAITVVEKENDVISFPLGYIRVKVIRFNSGMDYAILELHAPDSLLTPIPISIDPVESDLDLKLFHCPIALLFNDNSCGNVGVLSRWLKSDYSVKHHMTCETGAFRGSSGAPYVLRDGRTVGIHLESHNEAQTIDCDFKTSLSTIDEKMEIISDTVNSNPENYSSISTVLLISKCPKLVQILKHDLQLSL